MAWTQKKLARARCVIEGAGLWLRIVHNLLIVYSGDNEVARFRRLRSAKAFATGWHRGQRDLSKTLRIERAHKRAEQDVEDARRRR